MTAEVRRNEHGGAVDPLDVLTDKITTLWKRAEDGRVTLGVLLVEAKRRVEAGEWIDPKTNTPMLDWDDYVEFGLGIDPRSDRDIRRLLAIGRSGDPFAEAERQRAAAREGMAKKRARTNVSPQQQPATSSASAGRPVKDLYAELVAAWRLATADQRRRFLNHIGVAIVPERRRTAA